MILMNIQLLIMSNVSLKVWENPELLEYSTLPEVRDMMVGLGSRTKWITFTLNAVGGVSFKRITNFF